MAICVLAILVSAGIFYYFTLYTKGAETRAIQILPTGYSGSWQGPGAALIQDLEPETGFEEFNEENSAYPLEGYRIEAPAEIPTESGIQAGPPTCETCGGEETIVSESENFPEEEVASLAEEETATESEELIVPPIEEEILSLSEPVIEESPVSPSETLLRNPYIPFVLSVIMKARALFEDREIMASESPEEVIPDEVIENEENATISSEPVYVPLVPLEELEEMVSEAEQVATKSAEEVATESSEVINEEPVEESPVIEFAPGFVESVLEVSDFSVPQEFVGQNDEDKKQIKNIQLRLSMAFEGGGPQDNLVIEYTYDTDPPSGLLRSEANWNLLTELYLSDPNSNATNGGYWLYALPIFSAQGGPASGGENWEELHKLKVRFKYRGFLPNPMVSFDELNKPKGQVYLDAIWLEVEHEPVEAEETQIATQIDAEVELISNRKDFKLTEEPEFEFKYRRKAGLLEKVANLFKDEYKDINVKATVSGLNISPNIRYQRNGEFFVDLDELPREFKPGKYKLKIEIEDNGSVFIQEQDFTLGVLAINANKSIYLPNEQAYLQMAALKDDGHTLCDANLRLEILAPNGDTVIPEVQKSDKCGPNNVVDVPDYFAYYQVGGPGKYEIKLTNLDIGYEITDSFEVRESALFDIERIGPTRIYPVATYEMTLRIKANQDFQGEVIEYIPESFEIPNAKSYILNSGQIIWHVDWKAGEIYELKYQFDAPDISPYLYLLGPFKIGDWQEARKWQIAADNTISIRATGTPVYGTANLTPIIPTAQLTGDMMLCLYGTKPYSDAPTINQGWTSLGYATDGTTAAGVDVGSMQTRVFYKIATSDTETDPTITNSTNNISTAVIIVFQKSAGESWFTPVGAGGGDASAGTGFSVTASSDVGHTTGDMVVAAAAFRSDAATPTTARAVSITGCTLGAYTQAPATDPETTSGGDMGMTCGYVPVNSGTSSAAPVMTATLGAAHTGSAYLVRLRVNVPPTIVPNTADLYDFGADTTPTLEFTGSDTNADDLGYNTQIDDTSDCSTPLLDKVSTTDAGFVNTVNGGDTHPFTQAQKISYTVQAGEALGTGTYYWRARAIDPSGSNTYSNWTTIRSFTVTAANSSPTVSAVSLGTYPRGTDGQINLIENTDIEIVASATVTDTTCVEISGAKAYVFISSASWDYGEGATCSFDYNECYTPAKIDCAQQSCSGGVAVYDCTASASAEAGDGMWHHASPTDATASYSAQWWYAMVIASDSLGADSFATSSAGGVDVIMQAAIDIAGSASNSIGYGTIFPGNESSPVLERGVKNTGNRGINITIAATDALQAAGGESIASEQQEYSLVTFNVAEGEATSLSEIAAELDVLLPKPTTHTAGANDDQIFWGIAIPAATLAGSYTGGTTYSTITD